MDVDLNMDLGARSWGKERSDFYLLVFISIYLSREDFPRSSSLVSCFKMI